MPFEMVSGVDRMMGELDWNGDCRKERDSLEGKFWVSHFTKGRSCAEMREPIELSFGVVSGVSGRKGYIRRGSTCIKEKGQFWGFVFSIRFHGVFFEHAHALHRWTDLTSFLFLESC